MLSKAFPFVFLGLASVVARSAGADLPEEYEPLFTPAEKAIAEGDFSLGVERLNELVEARPGEVALATEALWRICLAEYLELVSEDWPDAGIPRHLRSVCRKDEEKARELISGFIHEAYLETKRFSDDGPVYLHTRDKLLETLRRWAGHYPLTPMENLSDAAPLRLRSLRKAGRLPEDHPALVDANLLLLFLRLEQGRFADALRLADELTAANDNGLEWLWSRAKLHAVTGSPKFEALRADLNRRLERAGVSPVAEGVADRMRELDGFSRRLLQAPSAPLPVNQPWLSEMTKEGESHPWGQLLAGNLDEAEEGLDAWIREAAAANSGSAFLIRRDGSGSARTWCVLDDALKALKPKQLLALRKLQEEECRDRLASGETLSQERSLALFRRFPWAASAHWILHAYARKELDAGRTQAARRAFRDLLDHSVDAELLRSARVGLWLSLPAGEIVAESTFAHVHEDETFPWPGGDLTARELRERLLRDVKETAGAKPLTLAEWKVRNLRLPAGRIWSSSAGIPDVGIGLVALQGAGDRVFASSRNFLARYDSDKPEVPILLERCRDGRTDRPTASPGRFKPALAPGGDVLYARWGYRADPLNLVALDASSGDVRWNLPVCGPEQASKKVPLGNPILAEGLLYVAAAWLEHGRPAGYKLRFTCVDAATGSEVWRSDVETRTSTNSVRAVFGDLLTLRDGALYCSTGLGLVVKLDARDGRMEWSHLYEAFPSRHKIRVTPTGSAPVLADGTLAVLPRDANVVTGLDARTGSPLWRSGPILPLELAGVRKGKVIVLGKTGLYALDARSGETVWQVTPDEHTFGSATMRGDCLYFFTRSQAWRVDGETGILRETRSLPETKNALGQVTLVGDHLYLVTNEPAQESGRTLVRRSTGGTLWELVASNPKLHFPKAGESTANRFLLHAGDRLFCMKADSKGGVAWQRFQRGAKEVYFVENSVVLLFQKGHHDLHLKSYDLLTGYLNWDLILLRGARSYARSGNRFFIKDNADRFTFVDLDKGTVLAETRMPRVPSRAYVGFGGEEDKVHLVRSTSYRSAQWLSWNTGTGEVLGRQTLKGLGGDPERHFRDVSINKVAFGRKACFILAYWHTGEPQRSAYRADYDTRTVTRIRENAHDLFHAGRHVAFRQEIQRGKERLNEWTFHSDADSAYRHFLQLPRSSRLIYRPEHDRLIEHDHHRPKTLRVHDLDAKRVLLTHVAPEDAEWLDLVFIDEHRVLLIDFRRNEYFRCTPYDLRFGKPGPTREIDYHGLSHSTPSSVQVVGDILLIVNREGVQAWPLS